MKKELIYILKRVIIGVLIAVILFSIKSCQVKALTNPSIGTNISEQGQFISLNSASTYSLRGYSLIKNSDFYYALPSGQPFTYGQYGGSITQCDIPVVTNNYYSLTYYFITADVYSFHPDYSSYPYKVGIGSNWLNTIPNFSLTSQSGANQTACISGFYSPFGDCITSYTAIFKANSNNTCVTLAFSSNTRNVTSSEMAFVGYTYESLGSQPLTESQMTTIINNANQQVINNITTSSQNIINNNNNNRDAIINNQNQNTQLEIESQKVCKSGELLRIDKNNKNDFTTGYLTTSGTINAGPTYRVSSFVPINNGKHYNIITNVVGSVIAYCLYDSSKTLVACYPYQQNRAFNVSFTSNVDGFVRFTAPVGEDNYVTIFSGEYCQNGNQAIQEAQEQTNQQLQDLNDNITSEDPPNLSSLNNSAGWLPPGPVDSILNLPLALLNNINTNLSKTCQPVILHIPLVDRDLPIPCITTLYEQMGIMNWINTIGAIASAFILFSYFVKLYKWVDDTLTFRENNYIDNWGGV